VPSPDDFERANALIRQAYNALDFASPHPVGCVQWVPHRLVQANDYNPNSVATHEMKLLHTSIAADGYTQPVVVIHDPEAAGGEGRYIVIDGFHRYTALAMYGDLNASTGGYLPVVILDKTLAERMASTVRHNRARGKHSVAGMGSLVFGMLKEGRTPEEVCAELGLEAEELARLTHITGYSKLFGDVEFARPVLTTAQLKAKAAYAKAHPEEIVPNDF
jgi:hypothetical protein